MGTRVSQARIFRSTQTSPNAGTIRDLTTAFGTTANAATSAQYAVGGTATWRRWNPNSSSTTADAPPSVGSAVSGRGWRDAVAQHATEQVVVDAGTWTTRVRLTKTGQTIVADITVRVTVIVYRVDADGSHQQEIGRVQMADTTLSTTTLTLSGSFVTSVDTTFPAGHKVQVEAYVTPIVAGVPTAPAAAVNVNFVVDETSANSGASLTAIPTYSIPYSRAGADTALASDATTRALLASRPTADTALASDSMTETALFPRSPADTALASDTVTRATTVARTVPDTALATDAVTRAGIVARSLADVARAADTLARSAVQARSTADAAVALDALVRSVVTARTVPDTALAIDTVTRSSVVARSLADLARAADTLARSTVQSRSGADSAPASDTLARLVVFPRSTADSALASDIVTRSVVLARSLADVAVAADALGRVLVAVRSTADTALAADAMTRFVIAARALADAATAADALVRSTSQARAFTEVAPASDSLARQLTNVRVTRDNIGPSPTDIVDFPTRALAGVVRNNTGTPVAGATVKLFRQSDDRAVQTTTSAADGSYSFARDRFDTEVYYVVSYLGGVPQTQGISERDLVPAEV